MELIRGQHNARPQHVGCVATIGNFDGIHRGHQAILRQLAAAGAARELPTTVITFEPQPQEFFAPEAAPARLMRLTEKLAELQRHAIDRVLCLRFDQRLATMPASSFVKHLLVERLGIRYLVVGDDFRFGLGREGDTDLLRRAGTEFHFDVATTHTCLLDGERVSSTRVRDALTRGDLKLAQRLLGRPYAMRGRVAHGEKLGRTIGYPTANIVLHRDTTPLSGIFAVTLAGICGELLPGVANIGRRPTVNGTRDQLEVHLFDFDRDIYGRHVSVEFLQFLRAEQRFDSLDALRLQIQQDAERARAYFMLHSSTERPLHG